MGSRQHASLRGDQADERSHTQHRQVRSLKRTIRSSIVTIVICACAGWLFAVNVFQKNSASSASDTEGLLKERATQVTSLRKDIADLTTQIDQLQSRIALRNGIATDNPSANDANADDSSASGVIPAVSGQGLSVTLSDSPLWQNATDSSGALTDTNVNDYVVHQQDLESVINALWAGGAEAMTIQGQRVLPTTAVRCVGNVLLLEGKQYAPPYKVTAIGPIGGMEQALDDSPSIKIYKEYVQSIGLGWELKTYSKITFPQTVRLQTLKYAKPAN